MNPAIRALIALKDLLAKALGKTKPTKTASNDEGMHDDVLWGICGMTLQKAKVKKKEKDKTAMDAGCGAGYVFT